jgi:UDP-glucose 4-epimerase
VKQFRLRGAAGAHCVLLFGGGIVGGAIAGALQTRTSEAVTETDWPWDEAAGRKLSAQAVEQDLAAARPALVSLVWAAGRSGMGSDDAFMRTETNLVAEVLDLAGRLADSVGTVHVHLVSSAGGLFDGTCHVGTDSVPNPTRPYGVWKLKQEALLADAAARTPGLRVHVYRPSTVYGFRPGARRGLIPVLVMNGLAGRTSVIAGRADTIRDYVAADDVGRFIAGRILSEAEPTGQPMLLASGRPAPIGEIVAETEQVLGLRLLLRYEPHPSNGGNMSFRRSAIPAELAPVDIRSGIRRVAQTVRTHAFQLPNR